VFSLSKKTLKLNLNFRLVVIFVLRLAKPLSENTQRLHSAKVNVAQCLHRCYTFVLSLQVLSHWSNSARGIVIKALVKFSDDTRSTSFEIL